MRIKTAVGSIKVYVLLIACAVLSLSANAVTDNTGTAQNGVWAMPGPSADSQNSDWELTMNHLGRDQNTMQQVSATGTDVSNAQVSGTVHDDKMVKCLLLESCEAEVSIFDTGTGKTTYIETTHKSTSTSPTPSSTQTTPSASKPTATVTNEGTGVRVTANVPIPDAAPDPEFETVYDYSTLTLVTRWKEDADGMATGDTSTSPVNNIEVKPRTLQFDNGKELFLAPGMPTYPGRYAYVDVGLDGAGALLLKNSDGTIEHQYIAGSNFIINADDEDNPIITAQFGDGVTQQWSGDEAYSLISIGLPNIESVTTKDGKDIIKLKQPLSQGDRYATVGQDGTAVNYYRSQEDAQAGKPSRQHVLGDQGASYDILYDADNKPSEVLVGNQRYSYDKFNEVFATDRGQGQLINRLSTEPLSVILKEIDLDGIPEGSNLAFVTNNIENRIELTIGDKTYHAYTGDETGNRLVVTDAKSGQTTTYYLADHEESGAKAGDIDKTYKEGDKTVTLRQNSQGQVTHYCEGDCSKKESFKELPSLRSDCTTDACRRAWDERDYRLRGITSFFGIPRSFVKELLGINVVIDEVAQSAYTGQVYFDTLGRWFGLWDSGGWYMAGHDVAEFLDRWTIGGDRWSSKACKDNLRSDRDNQHGVVAFVYSSGIGAQGSLRPGQLRDVNGKEVLGAYLVAERSDPISYPNGSREWYYKVEFMVSAMEDKVVFNLYVYTPQGQSRRLFAEDIVVDKGQTFARSGSKALIAASGQDYAEVCLEFADPDLKDRYFGDSSPCAPVIDSNQGYDNYNFERDQDSELEFLAFSVDPADPTKITETRTPAGPGEQGDNTPSAWDQEPDFG